MSQVNARILLWGIEGAGKTTTLETIHAKLRDDLRGDLRREPTRLDPTVHFEALPITLGEVGGVGTQIELVAVPGAADQAMTRKQLLDEVDGIVLVLDCSPDRIGENRDAIEELRQSLAAYGRRLDAFPIVLQYNKRDVADPFAIEDLHREIGLEQAAVFETIATTGHGVLPTLTTISKHVVRARRGSSGEIDAATAAAAADGAKASETPAAPPEATALAEPPVESLTEPLDALDAGVPDEIELEPTLEAMPIEEETHATSTADLLEAAILAEGEEENASSLAAIEVDLGADGADGADWTEDRGPAKPEPGSLRIVSVGQASLAPDGGVRLPLVLGDEAGESRSVVLSLRLDALAPGDGGD